MMGRTKTVRIYEEDVLRIEANTRLPADASMAARLNDVLNRVGETEADAPVG
jgi:hypothetical protein